jgi:transposase-like protein
MTNGQMGKGYSDSTKKKALDLIKQGLTYAVVAKRLGVSSSVIRNWVRDTSTVKK